MERGIDPRKLRVEWGRTAFHFGKSYKKKIN